MLEYLAEKRSVLCAVHLPGCYIDPQAYRVTRRAPGGAPRPVSPQQPVGAVQELAVAAVAYSRFVSRELIAIVLRRDEAQA